MALPGCVVFVRLTKMTRARRVGQQNILVIATPAESNLQALRICLAEAVLARLALGAHAAPMTATALKAEPNHCNRVAVVDGLSFDELAALLGEKPHKLDRFIDAGVIVPDQDGRFPIVASVEAYWSFWRGVIHERDRS
jgi:hypothetical protein